jgi:hypothetical protein
LRTAAANDDRTEFGKVDGETPADAARRAGDEDDLIGDVHLALPDLL